MCFWLMLSLNADYILDFHILKSQEKYSYVFLNRLKYSYLMQLFKKQDSQDKNEWDKFQDKIH